MFFHFRWMALRRAALMADKTADLYMMEVRGEVLCFLCVALRFLLS